MNDLPHCTILEIIDKHKFLQLPRLSSQRVFDALCPIESSRTRKRLCVILFTRDSEEHEEYRQAMRDFVAGTKFSPERVRFTYIYLEKQQQFINAVAQDESPELKVVLLWRRGE